MGELKKVIIVGPAFPLRGGIANFNEALCRSMNAESIETSVISFSLQYPSFLFPGKTQIDHGKPPADVPVRSLINSVNPLSWIKTAAVIRKEQPDLVIFRFWLPFMGPALGTIARLVRRDKKIKTIAITDNIIPHERRPGDKTFTGYFVRSCQGFIVMSQAVLNDLLLYTKTAKKRFLPHPVYDIFGEKSDRATAIKELGIDPEQRYMLFFGFIRKYKGLDLLFEAMDDDRVRKTGVKLIVAGEFYEDAEPYYAQIRRLKLEDRVILHTSFIPSEKVKYYFAAADIVVQPYRSATQSGVTQIAYNFDCPMLVTDVGGLSEIVPHGKAGYVTLTKPLAIADALHDFYENDRLEEMVKNVKAEKHRFSWKSFIDGVRDLYNDL